MSRARTRRGPREVEECGLGPVDVVEQHHQRALVCEPLEDDPDRRNGLVAELRLGQAASRSASLSAQYVIASPYGRQRPWSTVATPSTPSANSRTRRDLPTPACPSSVNRWSACSATALSNAPARRRADGGGRRAGSRDAELGRICRAEAPRAGKRPRRLRPRRAEPPRPRRRPAPADGSIREVSGRSALGAELLGLGHCPARHELFAPGFRQYLPGRDRAAQLEEQAVLRQETVVQDAYPLAHLEGRPHARRRRPRAPPGPRTRPTSCLRRDSRDSRRGR